MSEPLVERRAERRRRQLKPASIVFNQAKSAYDCVVRNVSAAGACLAVPYPKTVPEEFELRADGSKRACDVVWRGEDRMGVKFHD